jgi:hypothetical protein
MSHPAGAVVRSRVTTPVATRRYALALSIVFTLHTSAVSAQARGEEPAPDGTASPPAQALYKGVVGNLLEAVPIDPESRVQLQRFSAVVGNPLSGHSLAVTLGIASPPLMILGLLWGLWSAKQIQPADALADRGRGVGPQNGMTGDSRITAFPGENRPAVSRERVSATPQLADDPGAALDRLMRNADASALATVVGGASSTDKAVPCENCIMPMLYFRAPPDVR